jgi:hypothetical protein
MPGGSLAPTFELGRRYHLAGDSALTVLLALIGACVPPTPLACTV